MMQPAIPMKDSGAIIPKTIKCLKRENNSFIKGGVFLHLCYYLSEKKEDIPKT